MVVLNFKRLRALPPFRVRRGLVLKHGRKAQATPAAPQRRWRCVFDFPRGALPLVPSPITKASLDETLLAIDGTMLHFMPQLHEGCDDIIGQLPNHEGGRGVPAQNLELEIEDRTRIDVRLEHELAFWSHRFGVTRDALRSAVAAAGQSAQRSPQAGRRNAAIVHRAS